MTDRWLAGKDARSRDLFNEIRRRETFTPEKQGLLLKRGMEKLGKVVDARKKPDLMKDFVPPYDRSKVERDLKLVRDVKKKNEEQIKNETWLMNYVTAKIFEEIIAEGVNRASWFGRDTRAIPVSEYDDIQNGVDMIMERDDRGAVSHLGLAVDVTTGKTFRDKLTRIKQEIESGTLTQIDYFFSEQTGFKGQLLGVPRVVVGADRTGTFLAMRDWVDTPLTKGRLSPAAPLVQTVFQYQALEQISRQLQVFERYAQKCGRQEIAQKFSRQTQMLETVFEGKRKEVGTTEYAKIKHSIGQDGLHTDLLQMLDEF